MAKRLFDKEVVSYIFDEMDRRGYALVDEVAEIIKPLGALRPCPRRRAVVQRQSAQDACKQKKQKRNANRLRCG